MKLIIRLTVMAIASLVIIVPPAKSQFLFPQEAFAFNDCPDSCAENGWHSLELLSTADNNGNYTWCDIHTGYQTEPIIVHNFGFSIPSNATVNGITVKAKFKVSLNHFTKDSIMQLTSNLITVGVNKRSDSSYTTRGAHKYVTYTYGAKNDLWGFAWTPSLVNDPGFGVEYKPMIYPSFMGGGTIHVDFIKLRVSYSVNKEADEQTAVIAGSSNEPFTFPNPVEDWLTIKLPFDEDGVLHITNIIGQTFSISRFSGNEFRVNVTTLPAGIYIATLATTGGNFSQKFLKD